MKKSFKSMDFDLANHVLVSPSFTLVESILTVQGIMKQVISIYVFTAEI